MRKRKIKFLFIVQGEGRGHMTQSLALQDLLIGVGHEVVGIMIGKSPQREAPSFYMEKVKAPLTVFESPNFVVDQERKGIKVGHSIFHNLKKSKTFFSSIAQIRGKVEKLEPDVVVNFFEPLAGIYFLMHKPKVRHFTLSHHYLYNHQHFEKPAGHRMDKIFMSLLNRTTSAGACKTLSLSFKELESKPEKGIFVVPPLLRPEVKDLIPEEKEFLLSYILNDGYSEEIIRWHEQNRNIECHCFWDKKEMQDEYQPHENLTFHKVNDRKFLEYLRKAKAYASSAGFESVCEAMYLGKPVMVVPTAGHFEQLCNALDAVNAGAGISHHNFNLDKLLNYLPQHHGVSEEFQSWVGKADEMYLRLLEDLE